MKEKARLILANVLSVPAQEITDEASPDTVESWDSVAHMNLVMALEEEFGVQFTDVQILEMMSFELILLVLKEATHQT